MNIAERIQELEQTFNTKQAERQELLKKAEECQLEMTKLQGAYNILKELQEEQENNEPDPAEVIEAKPEEETK